MRKLYFLAPKIAFSFPVQLFLNNIQRNHVLMLCWIILFAMVTGSFGKYLGIPYLFLDPEYLNKVNFQSFFIMGDSAGRVYNGLPHHLLHNRRSQILFHWRAWTTIHQVHDQQQHHPTRISGRVHILRSSTFSEVMNTVAQAI